MQQHDGALIHYRDLSTGQDHTAACKYVVGCDGARSFVRGHVATDMDDLGFNERWLVVDIILNQDKPALGDFTIQYCDPERPITYVRGPGLRRRWEVTLLPEEQDAEMVAPDRVWSLLSDWVSPDEASLERAAVYTFHSLVAKTWQRDRVLIAGDAAHQTRRLWDKHVHRDARRCQSGLETRAGHKGRSSSEILESYRNERRSHTQAYVETTVRLGAMINHSNRKPRWMLPIGRPMGRTEWSPSDRDWEKDCQPRRVNTGARFFRNPG